MHQDDHNSLAERGAALLDGSLQLPFQWSDDVFEEWRRTKLPCTMSAARSTTLSRTSLHTTGVSTLVFCNVKSRGEERNYSPLRKVQGPTLPRSWQEESAPVFATALHDYTFALRAHHRIIYPSFSSTVQPSVRTDHLERQGSHCK